MSSTAVMDAYLAQCVQCRLEKRSWPTWPDHVGVPPSAREMARRASFHGIAGLLNETPDELARWPAEAAAKLGDEARLAGLWEETHHRQVARVVEELAGSGIRSVIMKGTALAYLFYDDPASRRRGDTDLLVAASDLKRTRQVLLALGFQRREDPHGLYFQETWQTGSGSDFEHEIDLHWEPTDRPVLQKILKCDEFFDQAVPLTEFSPSALAPERVLMLFHGAVNQAWHTERGFGANNARVTGSRRLIWSVDFAFLAGDLGEEDWSRLLELALERDAAALVFEALDGARRDIGIALPPEALDSLREAGRGSPVHRYIRTVSMWSDLIADLRVADPALKLKLLASAALAPRSHLEEKFPAHAHWPTFLLQALRIASALKPRR